MSSALEGRIRALAREEAITLIGGAPAAAESAGSDEMTALKAEVAELRTVVDGVIARLSEPDRTDQETRPAVRRTRKAAESE